MDTSTGAHVDGYAAAILEVARAEGDVDRISDELFRVAEAFDRSEPLREALTDRRIPVDRKQGIIDELIGGKASPLTVTLVGLVVGAGRARDLGDIARGVVAKAAAGRDRIVGEVRSAIELDEATVQRLAAALSSATGKAVEVKVVVDPTVIGGVVAQVGDRVFDGSVKHRLQELREAWG